MRKFTPLEGKKIVGEANWRKTYARLGRHPTIEELRENYELQLMEIQLKKPTPEVPRSTPS